MKSFKQITEPISGNVIIIDCLNLAFRWKHKGQTDFLDDYVQTVDSLAKSYKADKVILACDSGSSKYRKSILPEYKENRKEKFANQTEAERKAFEEFFEEFTRTIKWFELNSKYCVLKFDKTEADDIAAYIVANKTSFGIENIWLMSSDKDWDLLIQPSVSRFSYVTRKEITEDNWNEHYEYNREDHISIKCLTGDAGDNVPGIAQVGEKRAIALIQQYGTAMDIAYNIPLSGKYKYIANINEFGADNIMRNYLLMDLLEHCKDAIGEENCKIIDEKLGEYIGRTS